MKTKDIAKLALTFIKDAAAPIGTAARPMTTKNKPNATPSVPGGNPGVKAHPIKPAGPSIEPSSQSQSNVMANQSVTSSIFAQAPQDQGTLGSVGAAGLKGV